MLIMKNYRKVSKDIIINASKEKVWDLLFNRFDEVNRFNPIIEGSHHVTGAKGEVGCERYCAMSEKKGVKEKIVDARGTESFDIDVIEGNLPMVDELLGTYDLEAINSNQTRVRFTAQFHPELSLMTGMLRIMLGKMLQKMLIGLKFHLETGLLVTKGNIRAISKAFRKLSTDQSFKDNKEVAFAA